MRDPNRIKLVLAQVEELWKRYPDLRFLQLVSYLSQETVSPFNLEDDKLLEKLNTLIDNKSLI